MDNSTQVNLTVLLTAHLTLSVFANTSFCLCVIDLQKVIGTLSDLVLWGRSPEMAP